MSTVSPAITSIAAPVTGVISWVHTAVACSLLTGRRHRLASDAHLEGYRRPAVTSEQKCSHVPRVR